MGTFCELGRKLGPGCSCTLTACMFAPPCACFVLVVAMLYRAVVDKNPRKLQWKTPTYGPLVRPYHPYKEVSSSFYERAGKTPAKNGIGRR